MSSWKRYKIDQIKSTDKYAVAMGPFGSNIKTDNFVPYGVPVIRGVNLSKNRFNEDDFVFITEKKADELIAANAYPGDIVFTHRGTLGQVGIIPQNAKYKRYVVSQSQMKLRVNPDLADPYFIFYFFRSPEGQNMLLRNTSITGVPAISRPLTSLKEIEIDLPPIEEQKKIVQVLTVIDDKIELNQKMNQTLEGIARAIFQSWFVDFDPVRAKAEGRDPGLPPEIAALFPSSFQNSPLGDIPSEWRIQQLDQIANFLNGIPCQNYPQKDENEFLPVIKIAELRRGVTESSDHASTDVPQDFIVDDGDILFSWSGSLEVCIWCGGIGVLNQHLYKVTSQDFPKWFIYQWIKQHLPEFQAIASEKAVTMGHIKRHHLSDALVVIPDQKVFIFATHILNPLHIKIISNNIQTRTLANLRNKLLAELLSGKSSLLTA